MGMGGNGNELFGAIWELEWFFKCVNFVNGNGKDLAGMGGVGSTENHFRTSLVPTGSIVVFAVQKQNKNEFCVIELHVATSDDAKTSCGYFCGISVHVLDTTLSTAKVRFAGFQTIIALPALVTQKLEFSYLF